MTLERPVIASNLGEAIDSMIAGHPSNPRIVPLGKKNPWEPPPETNVLLTYASAWKNAPATPPSDWPRQIKWIQTGSAGIDGFPAWLLNAPRVTCSRGVLSTPISEYVMGVVIGQEKRLWSFDVKGPEDWIKDRMGSLAGKVIGIAGFGAIGGEIARRARAFDMTVLALTRTSTVSMEDVTIVRTLSDLGTVGNFVYGRA